MGPDAPPEAASCIPEELGPRRSLWRANICAISNRARAATLEFRCVTVSLRSHSWRSASCHPPANDTCVADQEAWTWHSAGIYAALHHNSFIDRAVGRQSAIGFTLPSFVLGLLVLVFSVSLGWLPSRADRMWMHAIASSRWDWAVRLFWRVFPQRDDRDGN